MPLIQRRRHKNNSQSSLNPDAALLVVPRPRPFSDISNDSNQDSSISPPLTPPLVGAKPPVSTMNYDRPAYQLTATRLDIIHSSMSS